MTLEDFYKRIDESGIIQDYIVRIKYKYTWETEDEYTIENEIYFWDGETGDYMWFNDWYEGQQNVEVLEYISLDDVFNEWR